MALDITDVRLLDGASNGIREIHAYWMDRRGARLMPRRADFDPIDLPHHLPGLLLIDVGMETPGGTARYRYRVVGDWEVNAMGHNPTGKLVDDGFHAQSKEFALAAYDRVRASGVPMYDRLDFVNDRNLRVQEQSIMLPFSEDGETVSQLLVYSEPI